MGSAAAAAAPSFPSTSSPVHDPALERPPLPRLPPLPAGAGAGAGAGAALLVLILVVAVVVVLLLLLSGLPPLGLEGGLCRGGVELPPPGHLVPGPPGFLGLLGLALLVLGIVGLVTGVAPYVEPGRDQIYQGIEVGVVSLQGPVQGVVRDGDGYQLIVATGGGRGCGRGRGFLPGSHLAGWLAGSLSLSLCVSLSFWGLGGGGGGFGRWKWVRVGVWFVSAVARPSCAGVCVGGGERSRQVRSISRRGGPEEKLALELDRLAARRGTRSWWRIPSSRPSAPVLQSR